MNPDRPTIQRLFRLSQLIERRYASSPRSVADLPFLSSDIVSDLEDVRRKIIRSAELGLPLARKLLLQEYQTQLQRLEADISRVEQQIKSRSRFVVDTAFLCRDLMALEREYGKLHYDKQTVAVVTEQIFLEDVCLGSFKIELTIDSLALESRAEYAVIALDPYPAASNEDLTHPHVDSQRLCEGDARHAIELALSQGRLHDFFQLVDQVLKTYNSSSAYCSLDDWGDLTCSDCGSLTDYDHCLSCDKCESRVCDSCECHCTDCDSNFCGGCCQACCRCQDNICDSCIQQCDQCSLYFCADCFSENERCNKCDEQINETEEDENEAGQTEDDSTDNSDTPVHTDGVGEAVVPA